MKNLIKDKQTYDKLSKSDLLIHIKTQIVELQGVSSRSASDRENFKLAAWPYLQAYELGYQMALRKLEEFINIKHD